MMFSQKTSSAMTIATACPGCDRRAALLYLRGQFFRCRLYRDLVDEGQREAFEDRMLAKARRIGRRLGAGPALVSLGDWIPKPKHMHWATYHRLVRDATVTGTTALLAGCLKIPAMRQVVDAEALRMGLDLSRARGRSPVKGQAVTEPAKPEGEANG